MKRLRTSPFYARPDNVLPLINVVLLLVLAFLIAGRFSAPLPEGFDPLRSASEETAQPVTETRVVTIAADGTVTFPGTSRDAAQDRTGAQVNAERVFFARMAEAGAALELRVDTRAPAKAVIPLLAAAEEAGLEDATIVTVGRRK